MIKLELQVIFQKKQKRIIKDIIERQENTFVKTKTELKMDIGNA